MSVSQIPNSPGFNNALIEESVDIFYSKLADDYRVNRFFNSKPIAEKTKALKDLLKLKLSDAAVDASELVDEVFTSSFARSNHKPSLVTGNDFGFLLDVIGGEKPKVLTPICESHAYLLKMQPDDYHYDVAMEHLAATLDSLNASNETEVFKRKIIELAEKARNPVLGRD